MEYTILDIVTNSKNEKYIVNAISDLLTNLGIPHRVYEKEV